MEEEEFQQNDLEDEAMERCEDKPPKIPTNDPRNSDLSKDEDINQAFDTSDRSDSSLDSLRQQPKRKPYALKVQVTAIIDKCENTPMADYTRLMKTCNAIEFTINALTSDTPKSKPFLLQIHNMATNMLQFVDPLRQILDTGVTTHRMIAPIRYLNYNMHWKKLFSKIESFQLAIQYLNPVQLTYGTLHQDVCTLQDRLHPGPKD